MQPSSRLPLQLLITSHAQEKGMMDAVQKIISYSGELTKDKVTLIGIEMLIGFMVDELGREIIRRDASFFGLCVHDIPEKLTYDLGYIMGFSRIVDQFTSMIRTGHVSPVNQKSLAMAMGFCTASLVRRLHSHS